MRVVMNARLPPVMTNVALPSLRSRCSQRILEWRFGSANVVRVPRHRSSVAGQLIAITIVPRLDRGLVSAGCGLDVSVSDEPLVPIVFPLVVAPPGCVAGGAGGGPASASSSAIVAMPLSLFALPATPE